MKNNVHQLFLVAALVSSACSKEKDQTSELGEAWDSRNSPASMEDMFTSENFSTKFSDLPLSAALSKTPWSGDYWATYRGGISYRWLPALNSGRRTEHYAYKVLSESDIAAASENNFINLSPAEKYDLYREDNSFALTRFERDRTRVLRTVEENIEYDASFDIPSWEGLCHSWAPATIVFESPNPVTLKSITGKHEITFGASDVKALLTHFLDYERAASSYFLGSRCNYDFSKLQEQYDNGEITIEELNAVKKNSFCKGVNPGSFHIVIANQIGLKDEGFILDRTRDAEVWNQPVVSYEVETTTSDREGNDLAIYETAAPGTTEIVSVKMKMKYTTEIAHSFNNTDRQNSLVTENYEYYLELNSSGEIIGGEWLTENRPDFMWKEQTPGFDGYYSELKDIYEASIRE